MSTPFSLTVKLDDRALVKALARLASRAVQAQPAMEDIARMLANRTEDSYEKEASPFGPKWAKLTERYVERPRSKGGRGGDASPILQRDGGLAGSITHKATADSATVAASKVYAAIHQFGGTAGMRPGPRAIPPRPFLPVSPDGDLPADVEREILAILTGYLDSP
jgi:phage virion morphogenesis protein